MDFKIFFPSIVLFEEKKILCPPCRALIPPPLVKQEIFPWELVWYTRYTKCGYCTVSVFCYPPKESSLKELTEWVSLFGNAFTCVIIFDFCFPLRDPSRWLWPWVGGRIYIFIYFFFGITSWYNFVIFFLFFLMCLAIKGNAFKFSFSTNKPKIELVERKWTQKSTLLAILTPVFWPSKKSISGLFQSCFGVV